MSQRRFLDAFIGDLILGKEGLTLLGSDRMGDHTIGFHLFWRRNLNFFLDFVKGEPVVPELAIINVRDISLRVMGAKELG